MFYTLFKTLLFRPYVRFVMRGRTEGEEHIPASGGVVLASNHLSAGDTFIMPALIHRQVTFPAKAELFAGNRGPASKVLAWFLRAVGQVPLDRSGGRASMEGLGPILSVVRDGGVAGIYPEGTRSPDGRLYKGKTGVARLTLASGAPVVPVAMLNSAIVRGPFGLPVAKRPVARFGEPLDFSRYRGREDDRQVIRWVTDEVMAAIQQLSGQTYVDAYATSVKYGGMSEEEAQRRVLQRPGAGTQPPAVAGGAASA